jgi:hypothetical protein
MTLDRRLVEEACQELWDECHERIEALGYTLGKDSMMHAPKEISIIAAIQPNYAPEMVDVFREIIPLEYVYQGEKIPVIISPPLYLL